MKPLPDDKFLLTAKDLISTNGMFDDPESFPFSYSDIVKAYGSEKGLAQPTQAIDGWTSLPADVMFRIPPVYIASLLRGRCPLFIYEIAATNPFPKWTESYRKANYGLNDIMLFNVAEDAIPAEHLEDWRGAVAALQNSWLDFCHGQYSWPPVRKDGDLGPICRFVNKKDVTACESFDELVGERIANRWRAVLGVSKGLDSQD